MRFWAILLTLLLFVPRVALAAVALRCAERPSHACCCCHQKAQRDLPESRLERPSCCQVKAPVSQAPLPATTLSELKLPTLALAPDHSLPALERDHLVQSERRPAQARAPPPERIPLFLKNRALLH